MNDVTSRFQKIIDAKFWEFWDDNSSPAEWDEWLDENEIKKMKYSEDGSEYSKIRYEYKIPPSEHHLCVTNTFAHMYEEEYKLLLVPYELAMKVLVLGSFS